jgi:hypothetical protein
MLDKMEKEGRMNGIIFFKNYALRSAQFKKMHYTY